MIGLAMLFVASSAEMNGGWKYGGLSVNYINGGEGGIRHEAFN